MLDNPHFIQDIKHIIAQSREQAIRSVDFHRVLMYWHRGGNAHPFTRIDA